MLDEGTKLASKALMIGSMLSVTGVALMVLVSFKVLGVRNVSMIVKK